MAAETCIAPAVAEGQLAAAIVVDGVDLVEREQPRHLRGADLREHLVDGGEPVEQLVLRHRRVDHVHDQVGLERLLERRGERVDQLVRQLADEADGVGEQVVATADRGTGAWSGRACGRAGRRRPPRSR